MRERKLGYTVPNVFGDYELDLALNYRYVAGYTIPDGSFIDTPLGALVELPSYDTYYFRAILRNDDWRFTAYVENLADDFNYNNLARGTTQVPPTNCWVRFENFPIHAQVCFGY